MKSEDKIIRVHLNDEHKKQIQELAEQMLNTILAFSKTQIAGLHPAVPVIAAAAVKEEMEKLLVRSYTENEFQIFDN